jgi:hypothetical protein
MSDPILRHRSRSAVLWRIGAPLAGLASLGGLAALMTEPIWTLEHWGLLATILAILGFFAFRLLRFWHSPARHPLFPSRGMDIFPDRITLDPEQTPQHVPLADIA